MTCCKGLIYKDLSPDLCCMTKKQAAYTLFLNGLSLKEISTILNISYNTITKWSSEADWKRTKAEKVLREQTSQERIWGLIDYQLKIIERITQARTSELSKTIDPEQLKKALIERGDIDALQKLFTTIKGKEITWDQMVKLTRELIEFIENGHFQLAKQMAPLANEWLNEKRESL